MPSISRRRLLGGVAALGGSAYGAKRLYRGRRNGDFTGWEPEPGTWPLARYDPANTAHNPHATPPRAEPEKRRLASVREDASYLVPLVSDERVALAGWGFRLYGDPGGETLQSGDSGTAAGFGPDGRLHALRTLLPGSNAGTTHLLGYDGAEEAYRHRVPGSPETLTVGTEETYVGTTNSGLFAYEGGGRDWAGGGSRPALADGRLYVTGGLDGTLAYRERTAPGRWLSDGPKRAWTAPGIGRNDHRPAVADGRVVAGSLGFRGSALAAFDADTGERLWEPRQFGTDGASDTATPAVVGRDGYVAAGIDSLGDGFVARYNLETGEEIWRNDTGWYAFDPAIADGTLVAVGDVRTSGEPTTALGAYDAETGEELWTLTFPGERGGSVALVGERVLATAGGSLYELA